MRNLKLTLVPLGIVLLVAGCGGGGSSGDTAVPVGTVQITSSTATDVAAKGMSSTSQVSSSGNAASAPVRSVAADKATGAANAALALFELARGGQLHSAGTKAIPDENLLCATSGTAVMSYTDNNNDTFFDVGDVATITYTDCVNPGITLDGSMSVSVAEMTPANSPTHIRITSTFTNYHSISTAEDLLMNGNLAMTMDYTVVGNALTSISYVISGTALNTLSSIDGTFGITDYSFGISANSTQTSFGIGMMVNSSALTGTLYIYTPTPLTANAACNNPYGFANGGSLRINGGGGSYVLLTPDPDCVNVVITGSDGTTPFTINTNWASL
ncbi:MAG: hypothetical protein Q7V20_16390 [Aquabacterium sp.]|uniref:hypothetical protein n=1 Tax=Aquabacterium sp. TaxID=1872578 RepID=UPI0027175C0B|nr:hypothetical protein [Aquabacterium sp.]MDO9005024.1 hypothetical protein [Aquabacterium sp.]